MLLCHLSLSIFNTRSTSTRTRFTTERALFLHSHILYIYHGCLLASILPLNNRKSYDGDVVWVVDPSGFGDETLVSLCFPSTCQSAWETDLQKHLEQHEIARFLIPFVGFDNNNVPFNLLLHQLHLDGKPN